MSHEKKITNKKIKQPMAITSTKFRHFEKILLDIAGSLTTTLLGNYILTMQYDFTKIIYKKYSLRVPLVNYQTNTVAEAFTVNFVWIHGILSTIFTDQETDFLSKTFTEVSELLKTN